MKVAWSPDARTDLADITEYIALRNPRAAIELDALLSAAAAKLVDFPMSGRTGRKTGTREILPHSHYRMVYAVVGKTITIHALVHTACQWPPVKDED